METNLHVLMGQRSHLVLMETGLYVLMEQFLEGPEDQFVLMEALLNVLMEGTSPARHVQMETGQLVLMELLDHPVLMETNPLVLMELY